MRFLFLLMAVLMSGCLLILDDECDRYSPDYSHTEYDCYFANERVEVCNVQYCWYETRDRRVCDEYHVCHDRRSRTW